MANPQSGQDWSPEAYGRFRGLRLRPAIDLLMQVGELPEGDIVDLGCGSGQVGPALVGRWPSRKLIGVDMSAAMLEEAELVDCYGQLSRADVAEWAPDRPPALIFSNAVCHWLDDHARLFARLAASLCAGGVLAVQMPRQEEAPSHRLIRQIAGRLYGDRFDYARWCPRVSEPLVYAKSLAGLGELNLWEVECFQHLAAAECGHPVRHFTQSTALRPILERLSATETQAFLHAYDAALQTAYPLADDGCATFPFRRLFFRLRC